MAVRRVRRRHVERRSGGPVRRRRSRGAHPRRRRGLRRANYTEFQLSKKDYISVRNEVWEDQKGERTGFANLYSSHAIGLSHNFNDLFQIRPEVGYYRGYYQPAFDDGQKMGEWIIGFDTTMRF